MMRLVGYRTLECGRKEMILEKVDERTEADKKWAAEHRKKIAEKFKIRVDK